jgi:hypothetical protein
LWIPWLRSGTIIPGYWAIEWSLRGGLMKIVFPVTSRLPVPSSLSGTSFRLRPGNPAGGNNTHHRLEDAGNLEWW